MTANRTTTATTKHRERRTRREQAIQQRDTKHTSTDNNNVIRLTNTHTTTTNLAQKKPDTVTATRPSSVHNLLQVGLKQGDEKKFAHIFQEFFGKHDEKDVRSLSQQVYDERQINLCFHAYSTTPH